jgi:predicted HTH transcriptional regulator
MPTTPLQIDLWRKSPSETQRLEFKEAKTQIDNRKLYGICVAIANEGGGLLILGIADKPPRPVVGTAAFNDPVAMAAKLFHAIGFRVDLEEVAHPDGRVLIFHIPSRPRGTAYHLDGAYLMRSGEELVPMSEDQLRRIFAEGEPDWLEEPSRTGLDGPQIIVPVTRFIDGYQSRNERLADLMRRFGICEEKSSGIDKVVQAAEVFQLPAPDFRAGHRRTEVIIYGIRPFEEMDRNDRIRACYQHCALKWVMAEPMTNQSLRQRFHLSEAKTAIVSQIIAATEEAGLIKADEKAGGSRKFARYIPTWA